MKYLFIGAHVDDAELSCGGFISKLIEEKNHVRVITLSQIYQNQNLLPEWFNSMDILGVDYLGHYLFKTREFYKDHNEILQELFSHNHYDFIVSPSALDVHSDHSVVGHCAKRAFKTKNLITYTGDWNRRTITHNYFVKLKKGHIEQKIKGLACYESQQHRLYMNPDYIWANARNMGVMAGCEFAEGFEVVNLYDS